MSSLHSALFTSRGVQGRPDVGLRSYDTLYLRWESVSKNTAVSGNLRGGKTTTLISQCAFEKLRKMQCDGSVRREFHTNVCHIYLYTKRNWLRRRKCVV